MLDWFTSIVECFLSLNKNLILLQCVMLNFLDFDIESIIDRRTRGGKEEVLVKWQGYSHKFNTWEPYSNVIKK